MDKLKIKIGSAIPTEALKNLMENTYNAVDEIDFVNFLNAIVRELNNVRRDIEAGRVVGNEQILARLDKAIEYVHTYSVIRENKETE